MATQALAPATAEERLIWAGLVWTYPLWFLGALYLSGPVLGWLLCLLALRRLWLEPERLTPMLKVWLVGMGFMLVALVVGHLDWGLGTAKLIKSSIGWAKGWALLALFVLAGVLQIRIELLARAAMHLALHTLLLLPLFILAWLVHLPETLYVSPLKLIGGPGPEFFSVSLYEIDPGSGLPRWRMFTPWAPALGFVANILFLLSRHEQMPLWRWAGIAAAVLMILMSQSRLAAVCLLALILLPLGFRILRSNWLFVLLALLSLVVGLLGETLYEAATQFWDNFKAARAGSTRVRTLLAEIALQRWADEAPVWGHGIVERGPHLVEYMPIGSHHSWYGLLFVKGFVGLLALAIPLGGSLLVLLPRALRSPLGHSGFCACALLLLYTFGENLEILAYLIWPALLVIGLAHCEISKQARSLPYPVKNSNPSAEDNRCRE